MLLLLAAYRLTGCVLLAALGLALGIQFGTGRINTRGLICHKNLGSADTVSPARVQLLLSTLTFAALYAYRVVASPETNSLPDVPGSVVAFQAASQVTYMIGKAITVLSRKGKFSR